MGSWLWNWKGDQPWAVVSSAYTADTVIQYNQYAFDTIETIGVVGFVDAVQQMIVSLGDFPLTGQIFMPRG